MTSIRALAANVVKEVHINQQSLSVVLPQVLEKIPEQQRQKEQAFLQELCFGSIRFYYRLETILDLLLSKPIRKKDNSVFYLMIVGLYQLEYLDKPDYAVVKETVSALKDLNKTWAKGLINGVMRNFLRRREHLIKKAEKQICQELSHPLWLYKQLQKDWGTILVPPSLSDEEKTSQKLVDIRKVFESNNQYPPMWLRINQRRFNQPQEFLSKLSEAEIEYSYHGKEIDQENATPSLDESESGSKNWSVNLNQSMQVNDIPGFMQGECSVQDASPQQAAYLLDAQDDDDVLDVCSAPGGKTAHILEHTQQLNSLLALDNKSKRLVRVTDNLDRLELNAKNIEKETTIEIKCSDALELDQWWDEKQFDRILLDVPCSATGVIRRNPDIKLVRTAEEVELLVKQQAIFLEKLWSCLKPGGIMLYATCSILRAENDEQIKQFMLNHSDAKELSINLFAGFGVQSGLEHGWQVMPGDKNMDGFYYAKLQKIIS